MDHAFLSMTRMARCEHEHEDELCGEKRQIRGGDYCWETLGPGRVFIIPIQVLLWSFVS